MDFGSHLRAAREKRKLTLDVLAERTKIPRQLLVDLEANDLSRWPRHQIYRHGFLRAYAAAVGLDADPLVERFEKAFPEERSLEPFEPPAPAAKPSKRSSWWLTAAIAVLAIGAERAWGAAPGRANTPRRPIGGSSRHTADNDPRRQ